MKYLIDLTTLHSRPTGIETVADNAAYSFIRECPADDFVLLFYKKVPAKYTLLAEINPQIKVKCLTDKHGFCMRYISLPLAILQSRADWNLFFAFPSPFIIKRKNCISVIHDLTPFCYTETMTLRQIIRWKPMIKNAVKHNAVLLTVSEEIKNEIECLFRKNNVRCIHPGTRNLTCSADEKILGCLSLTPGKFFLSVSTQGPRKNPTLLLKAFAKKCSEKKFDYKLVLTGNPGKELQTEINKYPDEIKEKIIFTGWVQDNELLALYQNTRLFILCSLYEGFGIPVIEAAKQGAPVLLSDIPVFHETTHEQAVFFKNNDAEDLCIKIEQCLENPDLGIIKQEFLTEYSWKNYAAKLKELINELNKRNNTDL